MLLKKKFPNDDIETWKGSAQYGIIIISVIAQKRKTIIAISMWCDLILRVHQTINTVHKTQLQNIGF